MVATTTLPAFMPSQAANMVAIGPAQQHAIAGMSFSPPRAGAMRPEIVEVAIGPAAVIVDDRQRIRLAAFVGARQQREAVGILQFGRSKRNSGTGPARQAILGRTQLTGILE